jgi:hypothetical protein
VSDELYQLACDGDLEQMVDVASQDATDPDGALYRWLLVASSVATGIDRAEARDWAADAIDTEPGGYLPHDEFVKGRLDVALWFFQGRHGLKKNAAAGMSHLKEAAKLGALAAKGCEPLLVEIHDSIEGTDLAAFEAIFPGLATG